MLISILYIFREIFHWSLTIPKLLFVKSANEEEKMDETINEFESSIKEIDWY